MISEQESLFCQGIGSFWYLVMAVILIKTLLNMAAQPAKKRDLQIKEYDEKRISEKRTNCSGSLRTADHKLSTAFLWHSKSIR